MKRPLSDDALADALLVGGEAAGCPDESLFWAVASGDLAPGDVHRLLDHAAGCADCSLALRAARELRATSGLPLPERAQGSPFPTLWERLTATVLAPRPALVYLLLAALLVPVALRERRAPETGSLDAPAPAPSPVPPSLSLARVLQLTGDLELRGERPPSPPPSLGEGPVLLRLHVDPEDAEVGSPLTVRLFSGPEAIAELPVAVEALATGTIDVLVSPALPGTPRPDRVEVVSGTRVVFRQSLAR